MDAQQPEMTMNEAQAIDRLIANKQQRTPFRQTEYAGQQAKARNPAADRAAERSWQDRMIAMATGKSDGKQGWDAEIARGLREYHAKHGRASDAVAAVAARESVEDALLIVGSYGPWGADLNDAHRRQIVLADEVLRLRAALHK